MHQSVCMYCVGRSECECVCVCECECVCVTCVCEWVCVRVSVCHVCVRVCDLHSVFIHSIASEQATTLSSDSTQQQQPAVLADEEVDSDEPKASNTALTVLSYIIH